MWIDSRAIGRAVLDSLGRWIVLLSLLLVLAALLLCLPTQAQRSSVDELEELAAMLLARYGANEAGLEAPADMLLVWQVAETHSGTLGGRVRWMRRHSRCVVARTAPSVWPPGNCRWARFLEVAEAPPRNWLAGAEVWESWGREAFGEQLDLARRVVSGDELARPCDGSPQTWDGWRWYDERIAEGFEPVECSNPWTGDRLLNAAYRFPRWNRSRSSDR